MIKYIHKMYLDKRVYESALSSHVLGATPRASLPAPTPILEVPVAVCVCR